WIFGGQIHLISGVSSVISGNIQKENIQPLFNLQVEYKFKPNLNVFLHGNNLTNSPYSPYLGYNVYGIHPIAGIRLIY
ncbi:MAG: TonB-dependent receptor, partial [Chitinophagales bacterium]|nr:TonB-dependent receptor [Chitinophagales bacterium]